MSTGLEVQVPQWNEMLSLYCTAFGFISKNQEYNPKWNIPNGRYLKYLILQKDVKQKKIIKLNAIIIHFYFQCVRMTMNNISTSGGLTHHLKRPSKIFAPI